MPEVVEQVEQTQDPNTPTTDPVQPSGQGGPWMSDLEAAFPDETVRTQVATFMGTRYQPYVTQLEQRATTAEQAAQMAKDFEADPAGFYLSISEDLFGEQGREAVRETIANLYGDDDEGAPEEPELGEPAQQATTDPRVEEALAFVEAQKEKEAQAEYNSAVDEFLTGKDYVNKDLFHVFVVQAEGHFDQALASYEAEARKAGLLKDEPTPEVPVPPAVLASDSTTPSVPPTVKEYDGDIGGAIDDFFEQDLKPGAPPVVGGV